MDTIFMSSKKSITSDPHRLLLNNKVTLKRCDKYVALSNLCIYYTWKIQKKSSKNDNVKKSAPWWNVKLELLAGSYSASDIPEYFKYFLKIRKKRLEKRILCEAIKLCESAKSEIIKDKNGENLPH